MAEYLTKDSPALVALVAYLATAYSKTQFKSGALVDELDPPPVL